MKNRLRNYNQLKFLIKDIEMLLGNVEFNIMGIGSISYDEKISNSFPTSIVEKQNDEILKLHERLYKLKLEQSRMDNAFKILNDEEFKIIDKLYIKNINAMDVSSQLNIEYSALMKRSKKVILKLEKFFNHSGSK